MQNHLQNVRKEVKQGEYLIRTKYKKKEHKENAHHKENNLDV